MDTVNGGYRACSWKNVDELRHCHKLIFGSNSSIEDLKTGYRILLSWKIRRSGEALTGVLCTLSLLDVFLKDKTCEADPDPFTLSTLYASALTKFINYATSFQVNEATMYRSAHKLGIDSFLIDLRHLCAHGKSLPNVEVFRKSHRYCLDWINQFFWIQELENVIDAKSAKDVRSYQILATKVKDLLLYHDLLIELLHKNITNVDDSNAMQTAQDRWPKLVKFMAEKKFKDFRGAFKSVSNEMIRIIETKNMNTNPRTFIHIFLEQSQYFLQTTGVPENNENSDDETENRTNKAQTIVNLYQNLIWQLAKYDHLKILLNSLIRIALNSSESFKRRESARFWTNTILESFSYYQRYCEFTKDDSVSANKITEDVRKIYTYQFDADLGKVFIFVGTQLFPTSLKYSRAYLTQLLSSTVNNETSICINLMRFVHPKLTNEQLKEIKDLLTIGAKQDGNESESKIYTLEDLISGVQQKDEHVIWKLSTDNVDWSSEPIGMEFEFKISE